jgi:hypothetical protein
MQQPAIGEHKFANGQTSQKLGMRDTLAFRYTFTSQQVNAFNLSGAESNTDNKSHGRGSRGIAS